jgi:hypothetical protein
MLFNPGKIYVNLLREQSVSSRAQFFCRQEFYDHTWPYRNALLPDHETTMKITKIRPAGGDR